MVVLRYLAIAARGSKLAYQVLVTVVMAVYVVQDFLDRKKSRKRE